MKNKIIFLFVVLYLLSSISVRAEVERREVVSSVLDAIEHRLDQPTEQVLIQSESEVPAQKSQNFLSDFYISCPLLELAANLSSFARLYYNDYYEPDEYYDDDDYFRLRSPRRMLKRQTWELGPEVWFFEYEEPDLMEEEGTFFGVSGSYTHRGEAFNRTYMLKFEGRAGWAEVDYQNSGTIDDIDDYMYELRGLGGYTFFPWNKFVLTPYFGFGYRYLCDDSGDRISSTNAYGYQRESNYFYSPIGIETIAELGYGWILALTLEFDLFWLGVQKSHLSDVNISYNDPEDDQESGFGARAAFSLQMNSKKFDLVIEPFIRYWNIDDSEISSWTYQDLIIGYGYEPANNSTEIGGKVAVRF